MSDPVVAEAIGVIDGSNVDFQTPVAYVPGTLWLFLNGQLIPRADDDGGIIEMGGVDVRLKQAPVTDDRVHFWFHTSPPTPGAFLTPPTALRAIDLKPAGMLGLDLVPEPASAEEEDGVSDYMPTASQVIELAPDPSESLDLRPTPVSAEEV